MRELKKCAVNYGNAIVFNSPKELDECDNQFMDHFKRAIVDELEKLGESMLHPELALNHETLDEKISKLEQWTANLTKFAKQMIDEKKISVTVYRWITTASSYLFTMDEKYQKMFSMFKEDKTIEKQDNQPLSEYSNSIDESTTNEVQLNKNDTQFMDQFQQLVDDELQYLNQFCYSDFIDAKIAKQKISKLEQLARRLTKFAKRMKAERKISNAQRWMFDMLDKLEKCLKRYQQFYEINNGDEENSNEEEEEDDEEEDDEEEDEEDYLKNFVKYHPWHQDKGNNLDDTKEDVKLIDSANKRRFSEQYWTNQLQKIVPINLKWMIGILATLLASAGLVGLGQRFHLIDKIRKYLRGNWSSGNDALSPMDKVSIEAHFTTRNSSASSDILPKLALTVGVLGLVGVMAVVYWRYRRHNKQNRQKRLNNVGNINKIPTTITTTTSADTINKSASKKSRISRKKPRKSTNQSLKTPEKKSTNRSKTARMISSNNNNNVISDID